MHENVLPRHSLELLSALESLRAPSLRGWTLAGGTGLAFRLGHRVSEDLDFFRVDALNVRELHDVLGALGPYETLQDSEHTLTVILKNTKLSFFRIRDPFLFPATPFRFFSVADIRDIALMKLVAISGRGARKDFVDLYTILRQAPGLSEYFALLPAKYDPSRINLYHILKSLTYFEDAEQEPMPVMRQPLDWAKCRSFFIREAAALILD
ncbi:MAG: nucleotidyl transferase AbiEii/AbiGii toxin family protein [Candidatus Marinimicrobia bacterium]|nr:nucleotidyl transferase AbiEii/AbiGii toxin family protein [Candidatus Neomarinimicrobiota bacterium]